MSDEYRGRKGALCVFDIETGEAVTEVQCLDIDQLITALKGTAGLIDRAVRSNASPTGRQFYMGFQARAVPLIKSEDFKPFDAYVMLYLQATLSFGGKIPHSQKRIAKELGCSRRSVVNTFSKLKKAGVIYRDEKETESVVYRMNDDFAVKGKTRMIRTKQLIESAKESKPKTNNVVPFPSRSKAQ